MDRLCEAAKLRSKEEKKQAYFCLHIFSSSYAWRRCEASFLAKLAKRSNFACFLLPLLSLHPSFWRSLSYPKDLHIFYFILITIFARIASYLSSGVARRRCEASYQFLYCDNNLCKNSIVARFWLGFPQRSYARMKDAILAKIEDMQILRIDSKDTKDAIFIFLARNHNILITIPFLAFPCFALLGNPSNARNHNCATPDNNHNKNRRYVTMLRRSSLHPSSIAIFWRSHNEGCFASSPGVARR